MTPTRGGKTCPRKQPHRGCYHIPLALNFVLHVWAKFIFKMHFSLIFEARLLLLIWAKFICRSMLVYKMFYLKKKVKYTVLLLSHASKNLIWTLIYLFKNFFVFLGLHQWHMEVPRPGLKYQLHLPAYTHSHSNAGSETCL